MNGKTRVDERVRFEASLIAGSLVYRIVAPRRLRREEPADIRRYELLVRESEEPTAATERSAFGHKRPRCSGYVDF